MSEQEELEKRVAELERKINLLADRVVHYYTQTTPEIERLKQRVTVLEELLDNVVSIYSEIVHPST